jgi:hypothetical protein
MGELIPFPGSHADVPNGRRLPDIVYRRSFWTRTVAPLASLTLFGASIAVASAHAAPDLERCGFEVVQPGDGQIRILEGAVHDAGLDGDIHNQYDGIQRLKKIEAVPQPGQRYAMDFKDGNVVVDTIQEVTDPRINSCADLARVAVQASAVPSQSAGAPTPQQS